MPYDGVTYLCCTDCGEYVVEGEAEAHERSCTESRLICRVCGERVHRTNLRDHLCQHHPNADQMDAGEVRDQYVVQPEDNSEFLGLPGRDGQVRAGLG
jgi:hypothetical protein